MIKLSQIVADTTNAAGGIAHSLSTKEALAQVVMTGTLNSTFYTDSNKHVEVINSLLRQLGEDSAEFVAKLAVFARHNGLMKETPAFLVAWLSCLDNKYYLNKAFERVIDNGKMLKNFVNLMRSGKVLGRKSLGTNAKRKVQNWLINATESQILQASVGNSPSIADVIRMVHPCPKDLKQSILFKWLLGKDISLYEQTLLPNEIQNLIEFRKGKREHIPNVPFELLTSTELSKNHWKQIVKTGGWHMVRMNLNTFLRKGILDDPEIVGYIREKLTNKQDIERSKVMPYQIMSAYFNIETRLFDEELNEALEYSLRFVPRLEGKILIFVDVSGSMNSPITGNRDRVTSSKMRCVDVASLIAASLLRNNPDNTEVVLFSNRLYDVTVDPKEPVMKIAAFFASFNGGGTMCQLPLIRANKLKSKADLIIYVSDNESWIQDFDDGEYRFNSYFRLSATETTNAWIQFKNRNPQAKMVCIDISPNPTTQCRLDESVLNIGGFSDTIYKVIDQFHNNNEPDYWVHLIENQSL